MMTISGALVTTTEGAPTLGDIAWGLARASRFCGHTIVPWTVAHHSLLVGKMAQAEMALNTDPLLSGAGRSRVTLAALLHDAHESVTADVPTTFKTPHFKLLQSLIDERIYQSLGVPLPTPLGVELVRFLDEDALLAEASEVTPPATYARSQVEVGRDANPEHVQIVRELVTLTPGEVQTKLLHALRYHLKKVNRFSPALQEAA